MGSINKCRDCSKCTERGITKIVKKTTNAAFVATTLGTSAIGSKALHGMRQLCPICEHPITRHKIVDDRFKD